MRQGILPQRNPLLTISQIASGLQGLQAQRAQRQALQQQTQFQAEREPTNLELLKNQLATRQQALQTAQQQDPLKTLMMQSQLDQARTQAPLQNQLLAQQVQQARQKTQFPGLGTSSGIAQQLALANLYDQKLGADNPISKQLRTSVDANIQKMLGAATYTKNIGQLAAVRALPSYAKPELLQAAHDKGLSTAEATQLAAEGKLLPFLNSGVSRDQFYAQQNMAPPPKHPDQLAQERLNTQSAMAGHNYTPEQKNDITKSETANNMYTRVYQLAQQLKPYMGYMGYYGRRGFDSFMASLFPGQKNHLNSVWKQYQAAHNQLILALKDKLKGPTSIREVQMLSRAAPEKLTNMTWDALNATLENIGKTFRDAEMAAKMPWVKQAQRPSTIAPSGRPVPATPAAETQVTPTMRSTVQPQATQQRQYDFSRYGDNPVKIAAGIRRLKKSGDSAQMEALIEYAERRHGNR